MSWYLPKYTAKRDPTLLSYFGLEAGNDTIKRRKVAETFLRPQTWMYFCEEMTSDNCTSPYYDGEGRLIVARPPANKSEAVKYFLLGSYHGHFNATDENDCDKHPETCTGHLINVQCDWSTFAISQAHHLGIPVKSSGSLVGGGYAYGDIVDIYKAANFTKSDILIYWWTPEIKVQEFHGTDAEFQRVLLPPPSMECMESRVTQDQRCSINPEEHVGGDEVGACDAEAQILRKIIGSSLSRITHHSDEVSRSPAYDTIKSLQISDFAINSMFEKWYKRNIDMWNYDPRDSVCSWAAENLSTLQRYIPDSYPRSLEVQKFDQTSSYAAMYIAAIGMTSVGTVLVFTWNYRTKEVFIHAQPIFLFMLLFGHALVCAGAILFSIEPTVPNCMARPWIVVLGNSLQMVPLIVKVSAINTVSKAARRMRRVTIRPNTLYKFTGVINGLVALYLLIWAVFDPNTLRTTMELTSDVNEDEHQIVLMIHECASQSPAWIIATYVYQFLLLVAASVLAFQNQKADSRFVESFRLALVIYSHFLFTLLRALVWVFRKNLHQVTVSVAVSILLSLDVFAGLGIYFLPKIKEVITPGTSTETPNHPQVSGTVEMIRRAVSRKRRLAESLSQFSTTVSTSVDPPVAVKNNNATTEREITNKGELPLSAPPGRPEIFQDHAGPPAPVASIKSNTDLEEAHEIGGGVQQVYDHDGPDFGDSRIPKKMSKEMEFGVGDIISESGTNQSLQMDLGNLADIMMKSHVPENTAGAIDGIAPLASNVSTSRSRVALTEKRVTHSEENVSRHKGRTPLLDQFRSRFE